MSARERLENGTHLKMRQGQEGVVIAAEEVPTALGKQLWLKIQIVTRMRNFYRTLTNGEVGWVPSRALKIGTYRKYGNGKIQYRNAPLRQAAWDGAVQGVETSQFGKAVSSQLTGYFANSGEGGSLPIGNIARNAYLSPTERARTTRQIVDCVNDADPAMLAASNIAGVSWRQ